MINKIQFIYYDNNLLLYDVMKFNYVRTNVKELEEEADEEISGSVELNQENKEINNSVNNSIKSPTGKKKGNLRMKMEKRKRKIQLTKEAIMALKYKDSEIIRSFILN